MKIALVLDRFDALAGGLEQWTVGLAGFLAARGHDVHVVTFAATPHGLPISVHVLQDGGTILGRARRVAGRIATLGADMVHDTGTSWSGDVFQPLTGSRRLSQARLVATHPPARRLRAALSPRARWQDWQMGRLERRQVRGAKQIVAVSGVVRDLLVAQHGINADRILVIPNGVDTTRFTADRMAALRPGARAGLDLGGATLFLAAAHNLHLKGVDTAIRALAQLAAEGAEVRLAVAGGAPDAGWTRLVQKLGVEDRVTFLGQVKMEPFFAAADVFVHPTRSDAGSLCTIEAGAAGLPVITTARNGAAELIAEGETGFVLPDPDDVAALAAVMRRLLDPALRARLGAAARAASPQHDVQQNFAAMEALFAQVGSRVSSPAGNAPAAGPSAAPDRLPE